MAGQAIDQFIANQVGEYVFKSLLGWKGVISKQEKNGK
jgi:hypothetical protein